MLKQSLRLALISAALFNGLAALAQVKDTIQKYPNGNLLVFYRNGYYELRTSTDSLLGRWSNMIEDVYIHKVKFLKLRLREGSIQKQGIFNPENGTLLVPVKYDLVRVLEGSYNGVITTRLDGKFGLLSGTKQIAAQYNSILFHPDNQSLLLLKNNVACRVNQQLVVLDSIPNLAGERIWPIRNDRESFLVLPLKTGEALLNKNNELIYEKGWTQVGDFMGRFLIVASAKGYGLYDMKGRKVFLPYRYRSYNRRAFTDDQVIFADKKQWRLFDSSGKSLLAITADSVIPAQDDWKGFFVQRKGLWGLVDVRGKTLQSPIWRTLLYTRYEKFEGLLANGGMQQYEYGYRQDKGRQVIDKLIPVAEMVAEPVNISDTEMPPPPETPPEPIEDENKIYGKLEIEPQFQKEGMNEKAYLANAVAEYKKLKNIKDTGKVVFNLIIERDGRVSSHKSQYYTSETLRAASEIILQAMTPWTPGRQNGRNVRCQKQVVLQW